MYSKRVTRQRKKGRKEETGWGGPMQPGLIKRSEGPKVKDKEKNAKLIDGRSRPSGK